MKAIRPYLAVFAAAVLLSGCYTQLASRNDKLLQTSDKSGTIEYIQPPPIVVIVQPVFIHPIVHPVHPLPVAVKSPQSTGTNTEPPRREIGNHRSGSESTRTGR